MRLRELPSGLPMETRLWAEALRALAEATSEKTSGALAKKLHCAPATLSRYLRGQRLDGAFSVVPRMVELANEHGQRTWTADELRPFYERATQSSAHTASGAEGGFPKGVDTGQSLPSELRMQSKDHDGEPAAVSRLLDPEIELVESRRAHSPKPDEFETSDPASTHRSRKVAAVLAALAAVILLGAGAYGLWGVPESPRTSPPGAPSDTLATPEVSAPDCSTPGDPAGQWRFALVTATTSAVWVNVDDPAPLKWKAENERVRLLDLPLQTTPRGAFEAVYVPKGSPTGQGWMLASDLAPCDVP